MPRIPPLLAPFLCAVPFLSPAVELTPIQPLAPTSVSLEVSAERLGGTGGSVLLTAPEGASSSSLPVEVFDTGEGFAGTVSAHATVESDGVLIDFDGAAVQNTAEGNVSLLQARATVVLGFDVPQLGGASTPVLLDPSALASSETGWTPVELLAFLIGGSFESTSTGAAVTVPVPTAEIRDGRTTSRLYPMIAGDGVSFTLRIALTRLIDPGETGTFQDSFKLQLLVPPPAIGTGDINGDFLFDVVDVTILRRLLAGLPYE